MKKKKSVTVSGTFCSTAQDFGFVECAEYPDGIFISGKNCNGAMHSDTVLVELLTLHPTPGKKPEGAVVRIEERGIKRVVGTFERSKSFGFVVSDNTRIKDDIFIPLEASKGAMDGHKVVVEITEYPKGRRSAEGRIVEILGHMSDPGVDVLSIVEGLEIPTEFPEKVLKQAERIPLEISEADCDGRLDLRDTLMITIDGDDAKDLDDAVSISYENGLYELGVHIADVTNYVQYQSALDKQALKRGTSVYLADRVIPMLPHRLCNGICSLNAGVDRLALSCIMTIDENGDIIGHRLAETVINVNRRMSYDGVTRILEEEPSYLAEYENLVPMCRMMKELSGILRKKRSKRGSIDFDLPETKIIVDEKGKPLEIRPYDRNVATKIIEDFMLAANETVASHFYWQEIPFLYRVHETPDADKIEKLGIFIRNFGYYFKAVNDGIHPKELQKLLDKIDGTPEEALISRLTLRSMKQAKYSVNCSGHFGLACTQYCHFTSPIRRYPDLQIHRIIKDEIRGRLTTDKIAQYEMMLPNVAEQSSKTERRATEAEREVNKLKKAQFMAEHLGEEFEGVISGITSWGIYVELPNTIEGMVRVSLLTDDFYEYHEKEYELVGINSGKTFKLGEKVKVIVNSTDEILRTIDFILAEDVV